MQFFTSTNWISDYRNSMVLPFANTGSDHVPCVLRIIGKQKGKQKSVLRIIG
jgi:hypothetical protein